MFVLYTNGRYIAIQTLVHGAYMTISSRSGVDGQQLALTMTESLWL